MFIQNDYKFTIIIPHYNVPELLIRCLRSIPIREDLQVIIVDDCSPNSSQYEVLYPEITRPFTEFYKTSQRGSAGRARNVGLEHARGEWLLFADSDDLFVDNFGEILDLNKESKADIIFFKKKVVLSSDLSTPSERSQWSDSIIDNYLKTGNDIELRRSFYAPWCKMIRRSIVTQYNIHFEETRYSNDAFFSVSVGIKAGTISVKDYPIYILTVRDGSLMDNYCQKPGELEERSAVCLRVQTLLNDNNYPVDLKLLAGMLRKLYKRNKDAYDDYKCHINQLHIGILQYMKEIYAQYVQGDNWLLILWMWTRKFV